MSEGTPPDVVLPPLDPPELVGAAVVAEELLLELDPQAAPMRETVTNAAASKLVRRERRICSRPSSSRTGARERAPVQPMCCPGATGLPFGLHWTGVRTMSTCTPHLAPPRHDPQNRSPGLSASRPSARRP